tara:strand:- start:105 stop:908 length:804 start_codon:yes stop_codon:yes gene_type:complete
MKLGIAYNIFDGEEMLIHSLNNLRPMVDFICVVYQEVSNFGNTNPNLEKTLIKYQEMKLIDKLYKYEPELRKDDKGNVVWQNGTENEFKKRNIGLEICRHNKCDAFMTIDCDELYDPNEFEFAKKDFELGGYDTSFTQMRTYYKLPIYEVFPPEEYYCPLFYKIKKDTKFTYEFAYPYPVNIDPTRRVKAGYSRIYQREEIEMYHYAYVRHNLVSKVNNTSAQMDIISKQQVCHHFDNFKNVEEGALFIGLQPFALKKVENKFNIKL